MTIVESIMERMLNRWYVFINADDYIFILLKHMLVYHGQSLEVYRVNIYDYKYYNDTQDVVLNDGYYDQLSLNNLSDYMPIEDANLDNRMVKAFAKNILED